jgi:hypothetical protein
MSESAFVPEAASSDLAARHQTASDPHAGFTVAEEQAVVAALAEADFGGALWREFAEGLATYAYPRITGMIVSGEIYQECAAKGIRYARRLPDTISPDDASEIVLETVARGLVGFRALLRRGGWDPTAGASLTSFFFGQCLTRFSNVAKRWMDHNEGGPTAPVSLDDDSETVVDPPDPDPSSDPLALAVSRDEVHRVLPMVDHPVRIGGCGRFFPTGRPTTANPRPPRSLA